MAAAMAALDRNDLLEFDIIFLFMVFAIMAIGFFRVGKSGSPKVRKKNLRKGLRQAQLTAVS